LGFTVFFVDVAPGEIVTVGAGITIGTSTLWTSLINVTMGTSFTVPQTDGTATFATVRLQITKPNFSSQFMNFFTYLIL
jgi:hypothetical protein